MLSRSNSVQFASNFDFRAQQLFNKGNNGSSPNLPYIKNELPSGK